MKMTLQNLKYIIEIADSNSFSRAAKNLYVSQSTLSTAVQEVEQSLGIRLFHRSNRGVTLTFDGEDFIRYAREIVEKSEYLENRYQTKNLLLMHFSVSCQHLPFAVRAFNKMLNELELSNFDFAIRECNTASVIHDVASARSEIGILSSTEDHLEALRKNLSSYDLDYTQLAVLPCYIFIRSKHPLAHKKHLSLKDMESFPFVTYDQENSHSHLTEEILFYNILSRNIHVSDRCTKIALIRNTDCFSIGSDLTNSNADAFHKGLGEIIPIPLEEPLGFLHAGYITKKQYPLSQTGISYLEHLRHEIATL
ncbi:LysR family transcriptional regulator [Lactonifactor longoviformis]|uniref:LysR family transcriptional regulator n=1 Tax=Lactonifactor longoviformis TaxID=341220 RepID=UPI0036F1FA28